MPGGRPRKWRPPPNPVGRPKKLKPLEEQLAKMTECELIELQRYQQAIEAPKTRWRFGDIHPKTGKYFLFYQAKWTSKEKYEKYKANMREFTREYNAKKDHEKELMNGAKSNTTPTIVS